MHGLTRCTPCFAIIVVYEMKKTQQKNKQNKNSNTLVLLVRVIRKMLLLIAQLLIK